MKIAQISHACFNKYPDKFSRIDHNVLRSAQPESNEIEFLKNKEGLTDIINFRKLNKADLKFNEAELARELNINYYHIPTITKNPTKENVIKYLDVMGKIKEKNGKVLLHCHAGVDRTGLYSLLYKVVNNIDNFEDAFKEMHNMGFRYKKYPNMINLAKSFLKVI